MQRRPRAYTSGGAAHQVIKSTPTKAKEAKEPKATPAKGKEATPAKAAPAKAAAAEALKAAPAMRGASAATRKAVEAIKKRTRWPKVLLSLLPLGVDGAKRLG